MFAIRNLTLLYGEQVIFHDASCNIQPRDKIGIVGRNGAGKSTLLHILAGHITPDEGTVTTDKKKRISYVPQESQLYSSQRVFDEAFAAFDTYVTLYHRAQQLESQLSDGSADEDTIEAYAQVQDQLNQYDYGSLERQTYHVLYGLGFSDSGLSQPVCQLSVGWQMRVLLARQLLQDADFYLFDEPTNHLDLPTKEWFLSFLKNMQAGYMLISHARHFLDNACNTILEIERGNITMFTGNFSTYLNKKEEHRTQQEKAKKEQEKEIARKRETIAKFKAKPNKAKMAKAMERQIAKMETIELEPPMPNVAFKFPSMTRPGKIVLTVSDVAHAFGNHQLFSNVSFELKRGQKAALIAANGVGKTTLFNIIAGKMALQHGSVSVGHNVSTAYFEQDQIRSLDHNNTIWEEVRNVTHNISEAMIRTFLGAFLFSGDTIHRPIEALSGGEKNRVAMVKTLLQQANLLLLDEPTNHLDIYAKDVLLQAVQQYEGTILYVSHDREFIEKTADTILELTPRGIIEYHGPYSEYQKDRPQYISDDTSQAVTRTDNTTSTQKSTHKQSSKEQRRIRKQIASIEQRIQKLEKQREEWAHALQACTDKATYQQYLAELDSIQNQLNQYESEWESLYEGIT